MAPGRYAFEPSRRSASEPPKFSNLFFVVPRRAGTVGRIRRARGSNKTVFSSLAKPTRVEGPAESDSPLIFIFQNDLSRLQQRFEVGQDARPATGNHLHHETDWKPGRRGDWCFPTVGPPTPARSSKSSRRSAS